MTVERARLRDLIGYVEAAERDRLHVTLDIVDHRGFRAQGDEIFKLPGVVVDERSEDDAVWLRVDRLARAAPPLPSDAELALWIDVPDDVDGSPSLRSEIAADGLRVAGLLPPTEADGPAPAQSIRLADYTTSERVQAGLAAFRREIWNAWALEERPRRRTIALYNGLFALRQSLDGGSETPIELVWGIGLANWPRPQGKLRYPLLTVPLEIAIDEESHAVEVRPRSEAPPTIETDALDRLQAPALDEWRRYAQQCVEGLNGDLSPFEPESFAPILRRAVALLDADGYYLPDLGERQPPAGDVLQVSGGWTIFERVRSGTQVMADLSRFQGALDAMEDDGAIPPAVRVLLAEPSDAVPEETHKNFRGVSTIPGITSSDGTGDDLFFPKPFNREQVEVIQRLESRAGVVVQGPPGTGKTHTIANIISHYLALGKRVLVTSDKAPALRVVRQQLPAALRPLAVSLLDSDRDGLQQFQESVDIIAERLHRTKPGEVRREIEALDARIEGLHRGLAEIDRSVDQLGRTAMTPVELDGRMVEPAEAARGLATSGAMVEWLPDLIDAIRSHEPGFSEDDIATLRLARKQAGARLGHHTSTMPSSEAVPDTIDMVALHRDLGEAEQIGQAFSEAETLSPSASIEAIALARAALDQVSKAREAVAATGMAWAAVVLEQLRGDPADAPLAALAGLSERIESIVAEARHFLTLPVLVPERTDPALREMIHTLAEGGTVGLLSGLLARTARQQLAEIRLSARAPANAADWAEVERFLVAGDTMATLVAAWNHAVGQARLDAITDPGLGAADRMRRQIAALNALKALLALEAEAQTRVALLLPGWRRSIGTHADALDEAITVLDRHSLRQRLLAARAKLEMIELALGEVPGALGDAMRTIVRTRIGRIGEDGTAIASEWNALRAEIAAIRALEPAFATLHRVTGEIEESGAPIWARWLREEPVEGVEDPLTPGDWRDRWNDRRLATWLARIDRHAQLRTQMNRRTELEKQLARAYEEVIELRTWCRLAEKASDQVRAALAAYAQAMRRLGRGTGIRAGRYRSDARAAADRAKNALPCWIMPHYRVSESLPADFGLFDLVIVDEASQSTIGALPALLRAKQVLIVGDDRQVSPDAGFREEARMNELAARHLSGQVEGYRAALREEKSLYDLGTVVFAGGAIMLKEHFRSVAPIIEFSKAQFYSHQLEPLRLPTASQRLDPPLIDILVEDGHRRGKVNLPEVDCIIDEIRRIAADPTLEKRSIGVTTLLGHEQALAISKAIEASLGTEIVLRHKVRVGEPSAFQGDERDIMFLSLVADRNSSPLAGLAYEQRFNVAASRARDRMILIRSVELEELRPADRLRRALIEHFRAPFATEAALATERRARCESGFEEEMFDLLAERGYRVDTQVRVGSKRIDMVVEGADDRRLAIECDGDAYHGPDRWPEDMARQRMLERAGWTVWRCFASRFVRDRQGVIDELVTTLSERGIGPETGDHLPPSRHTEQRRWRSLPDEVPTEPVPYAWLIPAEPFDASARTEMALSA